MNRDNIKEIRALCANQDKLPQEVLDWVTQNNWWNIWVPAKYSGLELPLSDGLRILKSLAKIDGSLGWTVTLCSGANFFIGNLHPDFRDSIFQYPDNPVCFGGSGGIFGTAEKKGHHYILNGKWSYATGAPYLTHFTLNAHIVENGEKQYNEDDSPKFLSFVVSADNVTVIEDWNTMGLKATATHSFELNEVQVPVENSFQYNNIKLPHAIFKVPFSVFADLTLWVNYLGMAEHLAEEISYKEQQSNWLKNELKTANSLITQLAGEVENQLELKVGFTDQQLKEIHQKASDSVQRLSSIIIQIFPHLGIKACSTDTSINQIFRDYFTGTQHHNFVK